jgi:hypothetical protein
MSAHAAWVTTQKLTCPMVTAVAPAFTVAVRLITVPAATSLVATEPFVIVKVVDVLLAAAKATTHGVDNATTKHK